MKIVFTDEMKRLLKVTGVPPGLIYNFSIKWSDYIRSHVEETKDGSKPLCSVSSTDQTEVIKGLAKLDEKKPQRIVLSATSEVTLLRKFMVPWFYNAVETCKANPKTSLGSLPLWHYVDFSFTDELLDVLRNKHSKISFAEYKPLLVLDGVSTDSSSNKVEKLRDILNLSLDHVVIILLGGENPYAFCKDRLGFNPTNLAVFNSARSRSVL